ncbi:MAG TPA: N-methyl-L-tryptophan oxidase [Candidatus Acidoferrum sp.]|nr:N-methyl-L-tryptophan oxidase [Candidatus Acidoferrum sp.]
MTRYDSIVLGVGGMGSAALYHLARRGQRVLGIEQFSLGHEFGSSHGVTRIIRLAYAEHPSYVPLLRRAYELWREMEATAGERLLVITGGMDIGPVNGEMLRGSLRSCHEHGIAHQVLDANEVARRFPGYSLSADMAAVYQQDGGIVLPERSIVTHVTAALALDAEVHGCERVLEWSAKGGGVEVRTDHATYRADRLVITAGPWASQAVPQLKSLAAPERQVLIWTQPLRPERFVPEVFPIFNMETPEGRYYGFPIYGVPGFKFGRFHHRDEQVDPDRMNRGFEAEDEAILRRGIARYFPDANGPTLAMKTCLFTNSPDEHFILDLHPEFPQVSMAAGFSGHGFKFAPVIGEIMADFAIEGGCGRWDLELFRLGRFKMA